MTDKTPIITILPHKRQIRAIKGGTLLESLIHHSIFLRADCGGKGTCGKCRVDRIAQDKTKESVAACRCQVDEDICIHIPESSMLSSHIMGKADIFFPKEFAKRVSGRAGQDAFGVAVDLGTTTIAVYLSNRRTGEVISSLSVKNPQALYGDDVMSRIGAIGQDPANLKKLQAMVVKSIEWGAAQLLTRANACAPDQMVVVGNPTMIHILAGIDPKSIGMAPYTPAFYEARQLDAKALGFKSFDCRINLLPQVSGFIGGDILAAAIAVDLESLIPGSLLIDLGTNGELILKGRDRLYATSCATGPAFEGASLSCGMQAIPGAINRVTIDRANRVTEVSTIQQDGATVPASGICGAGVLNAVARMCENGIVQPDGRFANGKKEYILVDEDSGVSQSAVYISQKDIRSVQLGKSALITGIEFLCSAAGFDRPESILIAGAFGSHQNKTDLIRLGLLPDIPPEKIMTKGNAAGSGAVMALCESFYIDQAQKMADRIEVVNLATNLEFQQRFIENLNFPDSVE